MSREQDAKIAEMLGLSARCSGRKKEAFLLNEKGIAFDTAKHYTTDPVADYEVLQWAMQRSPGFVFRFATELDSVLQGRTPNDVTDGCSAVYYLPGDYSRAALKVWEGE